MGDAYASGNWSVAAGNEDAFIAGWTEFLEWTKAENPGFEMASLIRDVDNPRHFVSFALWDSPETRKAWKASDGFRSRMGACRQLCDDMQGSDYDAAVVIR